MFYESLNVQNRMCELCTFSQIWSHMWNQMHLDDAITIMTFTAQNIIIHCASNE